MEILFLFAILIVHSHASHFRYGMMFFKPVSNSSTTVTMTVTHSFGWVNSGSNFCDATTISSGTLMGQSNDIICDVGCVTVGTIVGSTDMYCTAYSAGDWTIGYKSYDITFPSNIKAEIVYASGNWVQLSNGQTPAWSVRAKIDTSVRSDNGVINSSPISASASAYCIRYGYSYSIVLPITDPNQSDDLRCRWSSQYPTVECDGICDYIVSISNLTFSKFGWLSMCNQL
jgi:hypothetical protein